MTYSPYGSSPKKKQSAVSWKWFAALGGLFLLSKRAEAVEARPDGPSIEDMTWTYTNSTGSLVQDGIFNGASFQGKDLAVTIRVTPVAAANVRFTYATFKDGTPINNYTEVVKSSAGEPVSLTIEPTGYDALNGANYVDFFVEVLPANETAPIEGNEYHSRRFEYRL